MNRRQLRTHRSWAALLWGLAGFVALQLGLLASIQWWTPELRDPFYAYKARQLRSRTVGVAERPLTVVMLGSSRTTFGLKGGALEPRLAEQAGRPVAVFNFGLTGAGPLLELLALKRLLAEGVKPDLLLIEVLPPLFNGRLPQAEAKRLKPEQLWLRDLPVVAQYGGSRRELATAWGAAHAVPSYGHRYAILSRVAPALLTYDVRQDWFRTVDASGWVDPPYVHMTTEGRRRALERAHKDYEDYLTDYRLGGPACAALRELLDLCRQKGIRAALVWMPEGPTFRGWYPPAALAQIDAFLAELGRDYGVPLIDARCWVPEEEFSDSHHLMPAGAERFTERLGREALLPMLTADGGRKTDERAAR